MVSVARFRLAACAPCTALLVRGDSYLRTNSPSTPMYRFIQATCATSGDGLYEGLEWVSF